jgi:acyl-homoserine lactone acylase PvdQ
VRRERRVRARVGAIGIVLASAAAAAALTLSGAGTARAAVQPYGANDAGGFRNVLPPGEAGTANAAQLAAFQVAGSYPAHWMDQQSLYNDLIYAAPNLTNADVPRFFKDATFGVPAGQVESTTTPKPGVTIIRDSAYGVPHVYGDTREDVMFGAGYANAQDRLFLMDILRHTGRAELSSFIGGSPGNRAMDAQQWALAPYTDAELQQQIDQAPRFYGAEGAQLVRDAQSYIAGINAYIDDALANPINLLPAEYAALGKLPTKWTTADLIAEASLIGGIFGRGGGHELESAQALQALVKRFGPRAGRRVWRDFRAKNDPEAPTTVLGRRFPYQTANSFSRRGLAIPDPGSVVPATVVPPVEDRATGGGGPLANFGAELLRALREGFHASNWELVSARESRTGHPIGVLGPQVGYFLPQILMEIDLHGPTVDARGATFPGVGLFVLLGHGRDYAWSATTATADNTDTFAEVLCRDDFHYRWKGRCRPMEKLERHNTWTPSAVDDTPPGSETLTAYRTVHGIVFARGTVRGRKVAFVSARSTYFHEADSALFFSRINNPNYMRNGPSSFRAAAKKMNFAFNWAYIDSEHIAYQLSGWYPRRARGTSPDFPILGTGRFDWRGFNPGRHEASWMPQRRLPHAVDQAYLVSWNNKQAPGWAAADDVWEYSAVHRSQMISDKVRNAVRGSRNMSLAQLVRAMELPATQDLRALKVLPLLLRVIGDPQDRALRRALGRLRAWRNAGGHRRDLNRDGAYERTRAITLMDAWWPGLVRAAFRPALGRAAFKRLEQIVPLGDHTRDDPDAPAFFDGWWGQLSKDLRTLLGLRVRGWSRAYCGRGSRERCRKALLRSLRRALKVTPAQLYGSGDCEDDPQPSCFDRNSSTIASGLDIEPQPFQNRPTFQQTVSVRRDLP